MERIPFKRINLGNAYEEVKPLFESGFIGLGEKVFEFERELAKYVGAKYVVTTDSCTSALFLSLKYEGSRKVSIPSMTVPLVADACLEAGMELEFNGNTNWVGWEYPLVGTNVIDSAHKLVKYQCENMSKDTKVCFSFYPTKTIGSADGGAIATNDEKFADWVRSISIYGRNQKTKYQNSWDYDIVIAGYKRHYTNLQAAICMEQLRRLDETADKRRTICHEYNKAFGYQNYSEYLYRINISNRDEFIRYANELGIECGVHFKPLHLMTPFKDIPMSMSDKIKVEGAYGKTVSLPFYDTMTSDDVNRVISAVLDFKDGQLIR